MTWYLLSLLVKSSLTFAVFTRGSRNIRPVEKVLSAGLGAALAKVSRCFFLFNPIFSCLWLLITLNLGIKFSLLGVCFWWLKNVSQIKPVLAERQARGKASLDGSCLFFQKVWNYCVPARIQAGTWILSIRVSFMSGTVKKPHIHKENYTNESTSGEASKKPRMDKVYLARFKGRCSLTGVTGWHHPNFGGESSGRKA